MSFTSHMLGEIASSIEYGVTASASQTENGPKFLRITDIQDGAVDWESVPFCDAPANKLEKARLAAGDIVFARTGATTGKSFLIRSCPTDAVFASYLIRVRPGPNVDPIYLSYFFDSAQYWNQVALAASGVAQPGVNASKLKDIKIPLPPLEEQKRIADILDWAAELCRLRARALDKLHTLGQAIFHEMFGSVHTNPHGFERVLLGDLIKVSSGQGLTAKDMIPGDFPVYGGNGINGYHNEGPVGANRIVIGRVGVYCGVVHVTRQPCWVTDNALLVRQLQPCSVTYLAEAIRVADLNQYAGRAAQPLISGNRIYPVEILLPPEDQQKKFEEELQTISRHQHAAERASNKIGNLFASLQHRAFRGEL